MRCCRLACLLLIHSAVFWLGTNSPSTSTEKLFLPLPQRHRPWLCISFLLLLAATRVLLSSRSPLGLCPAASHPFLRGRGCFRGRNRHSFLSWVPHAGRVQPQDQTEQSSSRLPSPSPFTNTPSTNIQQMGNEGN